MECREDLEKAGVEYVFLDFAESLKNLKAFLKIRDNSDLFDIARAEGKIGIPCIVREDETVSLDWEEFM